MLTLGTGTIRLIERREDDISSSSSPRFPPFSEGIVGIHVCSGFDAIEQRPRRNPRPERRVTLEVKPPKRVNHFISSTIGVFWAHPSPQGKAPELWFPSRRRKNRPLALCLLLHKGSHKQPNSLTKRRKFQSSGLGACLFRDRVTHHAKTKMGSLVSKSMGDTMEKNAANMQQAQRAMMLKQRELQMATQLAMARDNFKLGTSSPSFPLPTSAASLPDGSALSTARLDSACFVALHIRGILPTWRHWFR